MGRSEMSAGHSRRKAVESSVKPLLPNKWEGFPVVEGIISCDFDDVVDGAYAFLVQADAYRNQLYDCYGFTTDGFVISQLQRCFLEGNESRTWWVNSEKKARGGQVGYETLLTDYARFKKAFVAHYFPADYVKEARSRLRSLSMVDCQDNLMSYLVNFTSRRHTLEFLTDKGYDNMYVEWLFEGLAHDVRQFITSRGYHEKTAKFGEVFEVLEQFATERPAIVKESARAIRMATFRAARRHGGVRGARITKMSAAQGAHRCAECCQLNAKVGEGDSQSLSCHACGATWVAKVPGQQQCPTCGHSFFLGSTGAQRLQRQGMRDGAKPLARKVAKLHALLADEQLNDLLDLVESEDLSHEDEEQESSGGEDEE